MFGTIMTVRRAITKDRIKLKVCFSVLSDKTGYPRDSIRNQIKVISSSLS